MHEYSRTTSFVGSALELAALVRRGISDAPVYTVALDGRSGSGKSTIAEALAELLGGTLVQGDDFFAGGVRVQQIPPQQKALRAIDQIALGRVLGDLRAGRSACWRPFDWGRFDGSLRESMKYAEPARIVIVEGVYTCDPVLHELIDLRILIEVDEIRRREQLVEREGVLTEWELQWMAAESWYFTERMPPEAFHVRFTPDYHRR